MLRSPATLPLLAFVAALASHAGCSLDLDERLLSVDGGMPDVSTGGSAGSADDGGAAGSAPDGSACSSHTQCPSDGCFEGTCSDGRCSVAACPSADACEARACEPDANVCGAPMTLGFRAGEIAIGQGIGCDGSASRCLAAMGDYALVGTADGGLQAYRITNPLAPEPVPLQAPPFAITRLVSSRNRVLVVGPVAAGKLSLAWIDVPADPRAAMLSSEAVAVTLESAFHETYGGYPGSFFLVKNEPTEFFPAAYLTPPLSANMSVALHPSSGIPAAESIVAASGTRLIGFRVDVSAGPWAPAFSLETNAGTSAAQNLGEQSLIAEAGEVPVALGAHFFTSAVDGSLLWTTNRILHTDAGLDASDAVVFRWPLVGTDTIFSGARQVVLETYPEQPANAALSGPSALVGPLAALVTAADPANAMQTSVRAVFRAGNSLTLGASRHVLPFTTTAIGIAGGPRFGYVLTPSTSAPPARADAVLHVFAAGCGS